MDEAIKIAAEKSLLKFITEGSWLQPNYEARFKLPPEFIQQCWALVDRDALKRKVAARLESELADRMVNHLAAEIATDVKQILSVSERREMVRSLVREHMDAIMRAGSDK